MKGFIRFVRAAMAGIALALLGAGLLMIGPDRLAELAADPPSWLAVSAIVVVTFAGALLVALLAREKPAPVTSEPYEFIRRPQPVEGSIRAGVGAAPMQAPARPVHALPAQLRLPEARSPVIVPQPPPPLHPGPGRSSASPGADTQNGAHAPWRWDAGPPFRPEEARRWHIRRRRRPSGGHRSSFRRVIMAIAGAGRLILGVLRFALRTAGTAARWAALGIRSRTLAVGRVLVQAWHHVSRALRVGAVLLGRAARTTGRSTLQAASATDRAVLRGALATERALAEAARVTGWTVARAARATGWALAHATHVAARAAARRAGAVGRGAIQFVMAGGRMAARGARAVCAAVAGGAVAACRGVVHGARAGGQAIGGSAVTLTHVLVPGGATVNRAGAGRGRLVGRAAVQTTRSATAAPPGAGRQASSASQRVSGTESGRPGVTHTRTASVSTAPLARDPFAAAGGAIIVGERRWGIRPSGSTRWHDLARHVHEQHGGDRLLLLQVARRIESKHQEFAQEIGAATRPVRYVNGALGALPLGVVVVAAIVDAGYLARLAAGPDFMAVAVAALLTAVGAWWLRWAARPPFTLRPSMRRALRREAAFNRRLEAVLERAALYAAAGLEGKEALREAIRSDPEVPGAQLIVLLSHGAPEERAGMADTPLARCSHALARWLDDGAPAVDALVLSAARLRNEQGPAAALHPALAFPVLICLVPAAVLLALL